MGRNIAENLVRLGLRVELVTVLGDDALSLELGESCARLGIGLSAALRLPNATASQYVCLLDSDGSLVGAVASMENFEAIVPEVLAERTALLDAASLIVVDANIPASSIAWLAERYDQRRKEDFPELALDTVSVAKAARARSCLGSFAFAKPNRAEAAVLAGADIAAGRDPKSIGPSDPSRDAGPAPGVLAGNLRGRGLREVFISLGEQGLYYEGPGSGWRRATRHRSAASPASRRSRTRQRLGRRRRGLRRSRLGLSAPGSAFPARPLCPGGRHGDGRLAGHRRRRSQARPTHRTRRRSRT